MLATNDIVFSYQRDAVRLTLRSGKALGRMPRAISHNSFLCFLICSVLFYIPYKRENQHAELKFDKKKPPGTKLGAIECNREYLLHSSISSLISSIFCLEVAIALTNDCDN